MKKAILGIAAVLITSITFAQNNSSSLITVEGKSSIKLIPEELYFTVNLSAKDNNYDVCADMAVEKLSNIKQLFIDNSIDEDLLKSNSYSIREINKYDPQTRKQVFEGYEANIPLTIKTKRDYKKNDLIFTLIKQNLESNFNLNFSLSDEQMEEVKEKLIALAVQDAKQKAQWITKASETELGNIKNIQYGEPRLIRGYNNSMELMTADIMPITREASAKITEVLSPNEIEMRTNIVISWEIKQ
ncbi:SIMPL domain-containing protein [Maribellus mangrovi]|uniref:SIMPL domain-containing protein n=1 Tax=Maribellus mangrovi TaxID=3133146 RepID=UPI0030EBBFA1